MSHGNLLGAQDCLLMETSPLKLKSLLHGQITLSSWVPQKFLNPELQSCYQSCSLQNEDFILDCEIDITEIEAAIAKLNQGKSCGSDGILSEHVIYSGPIFKWWLKKVFNCIISLEAVPPSPLSAIVVPIYKGKGRNPLLTSSYRGISLTSIIGKLFEHILLQTPILKEKGIPHYTQTAFQSGTLCADPTEVVQEAVRDYKVQQSTSASIILKRLLIPWNTVFFFTTYTDRINGKAWRVH